MAEREIRVEDTVAALLESKKYASVRDMLIATNSADVAAIFERLPSEKLPLLFRLLPKTQAAEVFVEMDSDTQQHLIHGFSDAELRDVVEELYVDDTVDIVEEMPANVVKRILASSDADTRRMINEILKYPEDCAGSIMTTEYVSLRPNMSVEDAMLRIRRTGVDKETIYTCYVTDDNRRLLGFVTVKDMLLAEDDEKISDVMTTNIIFAQTLEDKEDVAKKFSKYDVLALPVVDEEGRLVGIVTVDDAIDVLQDEATEDIEMMAAITPYDKPYLKTNIWELFRARVPWLLLLMVSATFTGMIITSFESALAAQVTLTAFIPMLMDTGGNSGSQASVTIIRSLSLGELEFSDLWRVQWKELRVALLCALTLAAANFLKLMLFDRLSIVVAATVCLTLAATIVVAKIVGCTMPMLAKKIGFDPAVMASPFITTIVDALSLLLYFRFATILLHL
ncbi:MAG: magnesium transporter [Clostridia bacterium]|nr:magnesium transporter [Clostridia bacterium]